MKKKKFKDRKDGKYIKPTDSIHALMPHVYNKRTDSEIHISLEIDITNLKKFIDDKNKSLENRKITYFHAFVTAMAKIIYVRPQLNRFIAGRRYYQRDEISFAFVAKDKMTDNGEERLLNLIVKDNMTLDNISKIIWGDVEKTRKQGSNSMEDTLKILANFPRWLLRAIIGIVKWLDYHGWVPNFLRAGDVHFATVILSNLGSIKSPSCHHHLNNYGTNSIFVTIGEIKPKYEINSKGKTEEKLIVDFGITVDERISDGFYFAKSLKIFDYIINHPELLDEPISKEFDYEKN